MKDYKFTVKKEDNTEVECELVLSYKKNGKNYLLFTDNTYENDKLKIYAYYDDFISGDIIPITNEDEFNDVVRIYNEVKAEEDL